VVAGDISPIPVSARLLRDGRLQLQEQHAHDVQEEDEINLETKDESFQMTKNIIFSALSDFNFCQNTKVFDLQENNLLKS
jgi:hypothetical protein